jgi:putative copper resistance protein D
MGEAINPWLHILAATIWVGPQVFLFVAAIPAVRTIEDMQVRTRVMRMITTRFGYLGWGALAVLVVTGIANLYENDLDVDQLFDLNFGIIFQVKMTLLIITVVLTALHSFVLGPRVLNLQESMASEDEIAPIRRMQIIVSAVNALVALAILFCGALLASDWALEG